jgi:hypothetical protein
MFLESSNIIHDNTNTVLLTYKDKQIFDLYDYISSQKNLLLKYRLLIDSYSYLLDSIYLLLQHNLVHNNINKNTICIHELNECKPIIMKFDHSISISSFYNTSNLKALIQPYLLDFDTTNSYLPLEFHLLSFIFSNKLNSLSKVNITTFINNIYNKENLLFLLEKKNNIEIIECYKKEAELYLYHYINVSIEQIINDILKYYNTWDNYRLSIFYLEISIQIELKSETEKETEKFFPNFIQLLLHNIHPNPTKRFSIEKTKKDFYSYY